MSDLAAFADFAETLADAAREEALRWSEVDWAIENKDRSGGFDPVTQADRAVEQVLRDRIDKSWPDHGIQGEEYGVKAAMGRFAWSLDPIDGTRSFICGLPTWTILIALLDEGRPVLGAIDVPRLGERFVGHGAGGWLVTAAGRTRLRTSACTTLGEARLATTDPYLFAADESEGFERIRRQVPLTRYGLDAYAYARLAAGGLDLVIETRLAPHDLNALIPVVRAAGGVVSDWRGGSDFGDGRIVAAASDALHDLALRALRG